jgi:hypothetical protein
MWFTLNPSLADAKIVLILSIFTWSSSGVEQPALDRQGAGSNPASRANCEKDDPNVQTHIEIN